MNPVNRHLWSLLSEGNRRQIIESGRKTNIPTWESSEFAFLRSDTLTRSWDQILSEFKVQEAAQKCHSYCNKIPIAIRIQLDEFEDLLATEIQ